MTGNPFAKITSEATRDAMIEQHRFRIEEAQRRVDNLATQVKERLSRLRSLIYDVDQAPDVYRYGAFGKDTKTIDDLLIALAHEREKLDDLRAADEAQVRLMAKFQEQINNLPDDDEQVASSPIPMGAGQYL